MSADSRKNNGKSTGAATYPLLAGILVIVGILRYRLLDFPLERDEGGFAYMAKQILNGIPLYTQAYDFKPPGLYLMYAAFLRLFGETPYGVHLGLLMVNLGTIAILFFVVKRLLGSAAAITAAFMYGVLSLSPTVLGFAAHATHFVVLCALAGTLLLQIAFDSKRPFVLFFSGIAFGLSVLMKQPGLLFALFGLVMAVRGRNPEDRTQNSPLIRGLLLVAGLAVPLGAAAAWLLSTGAFNQFLFWNFQYGIEFGARIPFSEFPSQLWQALPGIINGYFLAWFLAGIGIFFALRAQRLKPFMFFIACFSLASAAAVSLGFQFRSHYFVMILPALSLFAGIAITGLGDWLKTRGSSALAPLPALAVLVAVGYGVYSERDYFFRKDVDTLSRDVYYPNPFAEVATIAEFIKSRTAPNDKIAVLGSEPEILVGAQRFSATPYLFTYFFMEPHEHSVEMQKEMIASVDKAPPKIIVLVNLPISWGIRPRSERLVLNWIATDIKPRYDIVGVVDLLSPAQTIYKWNDEARSYNRLAAASILLLQRRTL